MFMLQYIYTVKFSITKDETNQIIIGTEPPRYIGK